MGALNVSPESFHGGSVHTEGDDIVARVHEVNRLTPTIVEMVVRAPFDARKFEPGQFFRLQNFESHALQVDGTTLQMEGIALTGAWTDPERGLLSLIILEMGGSSRLCAYLRPNEPVVVMGPTGAPTEIPSNETIVLAGGASGLLKGGRHVVFPKDTHMTNLLLALLDKLGTRLETFGDSTGMLTI